MKFLLAAVNAKYIHSNLGIYSLKAYAEACRDRGCAEIELAEYTINHQPEQVLQDIFRRQPDVVGFSCYIWNIAFVKAVIGDLARVCQKTDIWLGGPEVSFSCRELLDTMPMVRGIMKGEGEETFRKLALAYGLAEKGRTAGQSRAADTAPIISDSVLATIPGLAFFQADGVFCDNPPGPPADMGTFPFSYEKLGTDGLEHRIIYYESSRGCPFSCSYCLSSVDKVLRFKPLDQVTRELDWFLERKVPQVKFVDRTFNCKKRHAAAIWRHILDHDNGVTNFHFEIAADLLDEEELELLEKMRPGQVQLEIGVQSTNPETLDEIRRRTDIDEIRRITGRINSWHNIHQHLDLIAGLPYEGLERFRQSFNEVYKMEPEQLQLGFLKVLKGSHMAEMAEAYGLVCSANPPYEVLSTRWIGYRELLELKGVEEMVEIHYNSRQFVHTLGLLGGQFSTPYDMFLHMADFYRRHGFTGMNHSRTARYEILWKLICGLGLGEERLETYRDSLVYDLYLRENAKSRPEFARDQSPFKEAVRQFFQSEAREPRYLRGYEGRAAQQLHRMVHVEGLADGTLVLFDYQDRDPLDHNARTYRLEL